MEERVVRVYNGEEGKMKEFVSIYAISYILSINWEMRC